MKNSTQKVVKSLSLAILIAMSTLTAQAQKMVFGVRFMPTYSALNLKTSSGNSVKGDATFGYGVGGLLGYNFKKMIGVQAEVLYSSITQKYKEAAGVDFGLNEKKTIRLGLGYRGVMGLIDISDNSKTVATNSYYIIDKTQIKTNAVYLGFSLLF
ncbi:MAG: hypothetical protein HYZ42_09625 [Bacteroidetes bacterium]|nr:hypothetical protein [Bacteroidota bacterium]